MWPIIKTLKKDIKIGAYTLIGIVKLACFIFPPLWIINFFGATKTAFIIVPILTFYAWYFIFKRKDNVSFNNFKLLLKAFELRNKKKSQEKMKTALVDNIKKYDSDYLIIDGYYAKAVKLEGQPIPDLTEDLIRKEINKLKNGLSNIGIKLISCKGTIDIMLPYHNLDPDDLLYEIQASANNDVLLRKNTKYSNTYLIYYSLDINNIINHVKDLDRSLFIKLSSDELLEFIKERVKTDEINDLSKTGINKEYIKLNDNQYVSVVQLTDTSYYVSQFWLQKLLEYSYNPNIDFDDMVVDMQPVNTNMAITALDNSISELRTRHSGSTSEMISNDEQIFMLENLVGDLNANVENIFETSILIYFSASTIKELKSKIKNFNREVKRDLKLQLHFDIPRYFVYENYLSKFMYQPNMNITFAIQGETIANGYPNFQTCLYDKYGTFLSDTYNGAIFLNFFDNSKSRKGKSVQVIGKPGSGKTTTLKKWAMDHVATGNPVIMLDVENENIQWTKDLGGINLSVDENQIINPLQIFELDDKNNLSENIQRVCAFFKYYANDYNKLKSQLTKIVSNFYKSQNIYEFTKIKYSMTNEIIIKKPTNVPENARDFRSLSNDDFPIMSDFKAFLEEEIKVYETKEIKTITEEKYEDILSDLILIVDGIVNGSSAELFNRKTNFIFNDDCLLINVLFKSIINNEDDVDIQAYIHLLMQIMLWGQMNKNRVINDRRGINRNNYMKHFLEARKLEIYIDEEHRFINGKTIDFIKFLDKIVRQGDKYSTSVISASHNIGEYYLTGDDERSKAILHYFQNKTYKFFMLQESSTLPILEEIFKNNEHISSDLISRIFSFQEGEFLFTFGEKVFTGKVEINPVYDYFIHFDEYDEINKPIEEKQADENKGIETSINDYSLDDLFA